MEKEVISTGNAPEAIGPYSQAVRVGQFIFISGQIPIDPASGEVVYGDIQTQTRQVLENIKNILFASGSSLDKVVKTTIYMRDMSDYGAINEVYGSYFSGSYPARSAMEVSMLPKDVGIEIETIAVSDI